MIQIDDDVFKNGALNAFATFFNDLLQYIPKIASYETLFRVIASCILLMDILKIWTADISS